MRCWSVGLLLSGLSLACGGDDAGDDSHTGPSGAACPELAGTWTVAEHCGGAPLVGMAVHVTQDGCDVMVHDIGDYSGQVGKDGAFSLAGEGVDGSSVSCTGTATSSKIEETCAGSCQVVLTK